MVAYGYGPPPPPPPTASTPHSYAPAPAYPHSNQGAGRGGHHPQSRGHHQAPSQAGFDYNNRAYASAHAHPQYQQAVHYPAQTQTQHHQTGQWTSEHSHPHAQHHTAHVHAPAPLSSANYHPNYTPQAYPAAQYAPSAQAYAQPQAYGQPYQAPPATAAGAPQWNGQGQSPNVTYGTGRPRGGYQPSPGPQHSGPHVRPGYEQDTMGHASYGSPYPQDPRVASYPAPQYSYSAPPPAPPAQNPRQDHHQGSQFRRGRGGGRGARDHNNRGRGGHRNHQGDRANKQNGQAPTQPEAKPNKPEGNPSAKKKKRKTTNTLGLTPGMESESEDDEGEEATLMELIGSEALNIGDVSRFVAERRKNFPTKARAEAKKAAELARRDEDKASSLEKERARLRRELRKVESSIKRKREQGDEGDEMRIGKAAESSGDEEPEVASSRPEDNAVPEDPAKRADVSRHCKYYATGGTCGKQSKCRFVHDPEARQAAIKERAMNDGRLTIQQRLILNDKEQEDLTILQSIQYLRDKGLVSKAAATEAKEVAALKRPPTTAQTQGRSLLPAASPSLPLPPPKPAQPRGKSVEGGNGNKHQGWLSMPYGSSNGKQPKSDDLP